MTTSVRRVIRCPNCELLRINGHLCHETGCPTSYLYSKRCCAWCGSTFEPSNQHQTTCSGSCYAAYHGLDFEPEADF